MFNWVEDHRQDSVSCKCVFTEKLKENGSKMLKARLVAQGFEEKSMNERTDSPTHSRQVLRMVFVLASIMSWEIHSLDITSAFLQGNDIEREVFIRLLSEIMEEGKIWKLQRCIYGLNEAPRQWHNRAEHELLKLGGEKSSMPKQCFSETIKMVLFVEFFLHTKMILCTAVLWTGIRMWLKNFFASLR